MDERQVEQILQNPKFKEMVAKKVVLAGHLRQSCCLYTWVSCSWLVITKNF